MHAHHGQEWQQRRSCQHREHIAEVGRGGHFDVLDHVGVGFAPLDDALLQDHQVFFQQNDVSRFLCHIHGGIHGDTDVGRLHGRSIVDTVPHKAHGVAVLPEDGDYTGLLLGGQLGEHIGGFGGSGQFGIAHLLQIRTQEHIAHFDAHLFADGAGHFVVVTGENLGGYSMVL